MQDRISNKKLSVHHPVVCKLLEYVTCYRLRNSSSPSISRYIYKIKITVWVFIGFVIAPVMCMSVGQILQMIRFLLRPSLGSWFSRFLLCLLFLLSLVSKIFLFRFFKKNLSNFLFQVLFGGW